MANMTSGGVVGKSGVPDPKMKSITFTHTAAGTAAGTVASTEKLHGTLLMVYTDTGGDASWDLTLTVGGADVWVRAAMGTGAEVFPLGIMHDAGRPAADTEVTMWGIPISGQALTCTTANMSGSGTGPAITIVFRED